MTKKNKEAIVNGVIIAALTALSVYIYRNTPDDVE